MSASEGPVEPRPSHAELVDLFEVFLLGERPSLTGQQIADEVGISLDTARQRWRSLGFTEVGDDVVAFTQADLEAMRLTQRLREVGIIDDEDESALVRTIGRSFARLAEWQLGLLARTLDVDEMSVEEMQDVIEVVTPTVEQLQNYVWRRHTLNAASRLLLAAPREEDDASEGPAVPQVVGFADIVNYTRQSRSLSNLELARLVDDFEGRALAIMSKRGGRIIKSIGDEVLFVADDPLQGALIGMELIEERAKDEDFPELRVGLAWGPALARLGDVYGPVVNVASRLTSASRPGRVLADRALAEELRGSEHVKLRRMRRISVKGYRHLEPYALRRPADEDPEIAEDGNLPGPASQFLAQHTQDFFRALDVMQSRREPRSLKAGPDASADPGSQTEPDEGP